MFVAHVFFMFMVNHQQPAIIFGPMVQPAITWGDTLLGRTPTSATSLSGSSEQSAVGQWESPE